MTLHEPGIRVLTLTDAGKRSLTRASLWILVPLVVMFLGLGVFMLAISRSSGGAAGMGSLQAAVYIGGAGLLLAIAAILFPLEVRRTRVVFGDGSYTISGLFGSRHFKVPDIERVVQVRQTTTPMGPESQLIVVSPAKRLALLSSSRWSPAQLSALSADLATRGVPVIDIQDPVTRAELRTLDRRLATFVEANQVALMVSLLVLVIPLLLVLLILLGLLAFLLSTRPG